MFCIDLHAILQIKYIIFKGLFTNISARWPGSAHDSHVFRTSAVGRHLEHNYRGIDQGVLLGDSGYPCRPFLLTPYRQPADRSQHRFNRSHCSTRSTIERVFGIWKKRFHVLGSQVLNLKMMWLEFVLFYLFFF